MGLHTYARLPGPFYYRGGTITALFVLCLYLVWWTIVIMIAAVYFLGAFLVVVGRYTAQRTALARQHHAAKKTLAH